MVSEYCPQHDHNIMLHPPRHARPWSRQGFLSSQELDLIGLSIPCPNYNPGFELQPTSYLSQSNTLILRNKTASPQERTLTLPHYRA